MNHAPSEIGEPQLFILMMGRNCERWVSRSVESLRSQEHESFTCLFIDDASSDSSLERATDAIAGDTRFVVKRNDERRYTLSNRLSAIADSGARDSDVFIVLDADDWLSDRGVLSHLVEVYQDPEVWLTYGSYAVWKDSIRYRLGIRKKRGLSRPFAEDVVEQRAFREQPITASHLRSYRRFLWDAIPHEDLLDERGEVMHCTEDFATMIPMLEMAGGDHSLFIERIMYTYNASNPHGVKRERREEQLSNERLVRSRAVRGRLDACHVDPDAETVAVRDGLPREAGTGDD